MQQAALISPVEKIIALQSSFLASKTISDRKSLGQFFTGSIVSDYMASLIAKPKTKTVRILDAQLMGSEPFNSFGSKKTGAQVIAGVR